jgi:hypothetical protein
MTTVREAMRALEQVSGVVRTAPTRWFWIRLGPVSIPVPHPGRLREHDLHHVALGAATDVRSEAEVSAFELRTGPPSVLIWLLCVASCALGLLLAPRRTVHAWQRARRCRNCYGRDVNLDVLLDLTVDELRAWMHLREPTSSTNVTNE